MDSKASTGGVKAVVLVGGPSKGTRFRPLSLDIAKPLFPIAGYPLIYHPVEACARQLKNLTEIILIGFYDEQDKQWQEFFNNTRSQLGLPIRYLREDSRLGTAGGLRKFKKELLEGNPEYLILMHCDIMCAFPIRELMDFHVQHGKECTILAKQVPKEEATKYGCLIVEKTTNEALHYAEKPETFVGDIINAGIYVLNPTFFDLIDKAAHPKHELGETEEFLRLEQDVLQNICGEKHVYVYVTPDFWFQLKSAGMVVPCASHLLAHIRRTHPEQLAKKGDGKTTPTIVGDVLIHPTAQVDPTAKIGPNVSIGAKAKIGAGVRIQHSIILDNAEIKARCCILYSIIGWNSTVGVWSRLEGLPDFSADSDDPLKCGITILGSGVTVGPESVVRASIALPHKELSGSYNNMILL